MDSALESWNESAGELGSGQVRVLHVDDDRSFADLAAEFLERERERFDVVTEHSATDALERLDDDDVDCIVSDYKMPDRTGLEFFESIPAEYRDVPFVLFTGQGSEEVASDALSAGVTDYLQKETGTDQYTVLANRIEQAVSNAAYRERLDLLRRRFRTLVEASSDAILVVSPEGVVRYATPATRHILGRTPEDLVGVSGFDLVHPSDVEAVSAELTRLLENPETEANVEFRYAHADESWVWLEIRGRNLLDNPDIGGIVVYARDVDERKEREQLLTRREGKFRAVFEEAFDGMVIVDDEGTFVDANPAACALLGQDRDALLGRSMADVLPDDVDFRDRWADFVDTDGERGLIDVVRADGERRTVEFAATPDILPGRHLSVIRAVSDGDDESATKR